MSARSVVARFSQTRLERGQGIVEMAIATPLLLLILLGTIDMGRMFFDYVEMRQAAVEGATYGARKPTDINGITSVVKAHGIPSDAAVDISSDPGCSTPGGSGNVRVTASRVWTPISIGVLEVIGQDGTWSFTINARSTMRCMT